MKSLIHLLPLLGIFFLVTSCTPTQYSTSSNAMYERSVLYDNTWELAELNGVTFARPADRYSYITFSPNSSQIYGYTTCNNLGGTVAFTDNDGFRITPIVTTKNVCTNNNVDLTLMPSLRNVDSWAVVDDDLIMYQDGKTIARWVPSDYSDDDLEGNWQLSFVSDHQLPFDVLYPADKRPTLVFGSNNNIVNGTTGYNTISCPIQVSGNGIAFTDCKSTELACQGPGESFFMDNLKKIDHYAFTDRNTMVLVTDDNKVMRFTRL
jgi:heat shock protein HslJ